MKLTEETRKRRVKAHAKHHRLPFQEGTYYRTGADGNNVECVVDCWLYPKPHWTVKERGSKSREPLTLDLWNELRPLKL